MVNGWKVISILIFVICVGLVGKIIWDKYNFNKRTDQLNSELMQAKLELGKAHTQFGDASKKIDELSKKLQEEIKLHNESITQYSDLWARYQVLVNNASGVIDPQPHPGSVVVCDNPIFEPGAYYLAQNTSEVLCLGKELQSSYTDGRLHLTHKYLSVGVSSELTLKQTFESKVLINYILDMQIKLKFVTTIAPTGAVNNYTEIYEIDQSGKEAGKFEITKFESVVQDHRKPHFFWWIPHLDLSGSVRLTTDFKASSIVSLGFSAMGHGLTANDLSWRFMRAGVNMGGKTLGLDFALAQYNIGDPIPLVSNLWIGPFVSYDLNRQMGVGVHLSLML